MNPYRVLGISESSSRRDVAAAYRQLAEGTKGKKAALLKAALLDIYQRTQKPVAGSIEYNCNYAGFEYEFPALNYDKVLEAEGKRKVVPSTDPEKRARQKLHIQNFYKKKRERADWARGDEEEKAWLASQKNEAEGNNCICGKPWNDPTHDSVAASRGSLPKGTYHKFKREEVCDDCGAPGPLYGGSHKICAKCADSNYDGMGESVSPTGITGIILEQHVYIDHCLICDKKKTMRSISPFEEQCDKCGTKYYRTDKHAGELVKMDEDAKILQFPRKDTKLMNPNAVDAAAHNSDKEFFRAALKGGKRFDYAGAVGAHEGSPHQLCKGNTMRCDYPSDKGMCGEKAEHVLRNGVSAVCGEHYKKALGDHKRLKDVTDHAEVDDDYWRESTDESKKDKRGDNKEIEDDSPIYCLNACGKQVPSNNALQPFCSSECHGEYNKTGDDWQIPDPVGMGHDAIINATPKKQEKNHNVKPKKVDESLMGLGKEDPNKALAYPELSCNICGITKLREEFKNRSDTRTGKKYSCRDCDKELKKGYRHGETAEQVREGIKYADKKYKFLGDDKTAKKQKSIIGVCASADVLPADVVEARGERQCAGHWAKPNCDKPAKFMATSGTKYCGEHSKALAGRWWKKWDEATGKWVSRNDLKEERYDYCSTQVDVPKQYAKKVLAAGKEMIDPKDLCQEDGGMEETPHVTVKYGLHEKDTDALTKALEGEKPFTITLGETKVFKANEKRPDSDVVVVEVESPDLHRMNKKVADAVPHTDTYPDYHPHMTIAYVKKGTGAKYEGRDDLSGIQIRFNAVQASDKDGSKTPVILSGKD